ncbi:MAG: hypothetical protein M1832_002218 [Thelocarpon impressellum]|nr:MAG: hypothetical protein M1832_002218 [Thelocarpon impressellum]
MTTLHCPADYIRHIMSEHGFGRSSPLCKPISEEEQARLGPVGSGVPPTRTAVRAMPSTTSPPEPAGRHDAFTAGDFDGLWRYLHDARFPGGSPIEVRSVLDAGPTLAPPPVTKSLPPTFSRPAKPSSRPKAIIHIGVPQLGVEPGATIIPNVIQSPFDAESSWSTAPNVSAMPSPSMDSTTSHQLDSAWTQFSPVSSRSSPPGREISLNDTGFTASLRHYLLSDPGGDDCPAAKVDGWLGNIEAIGQRPPSAAKPAPAKAQSYNGRSVPTPQVPFVQVPHPPFAQPYIPAGFPVPGPQMHPLGYLPGRRNRAVSEQMPGQFVAGQQPHYRHHSEQVAPRSGHIASGTVLSGHDQNTFEQMKLMQKEMAAGPGNVHLRDRYF